MYNLDEEKIECKVGNQEFFLARQGSLECCGFITDVGTHGIYLSLTLCTVKFKQRDYSFSLKNLNLLV